MNRKIAKLITLMRDFVRDKHPDWKQVEGSFRIDGIYYDWKIEKRKEKV